MAKIRLYDAVGAQAGTVDLPSDLAQRTISPATFAQVVRVLRQNWRQGTVACKSRGEVSFSNKKPWRQKGTGRARAGRMSSPLWRKGGVIFGPQPRVRMLDINKKQKRSSLNNLLFVKANGERVHCVDFMCANTPSTKLLNTFLKKAGFLGKKIVLFMAPDDAIMYASARNIDGVQCMFFDTPNAFDLSHAEHWVFMKKDMDLFNGMVRQWN